MLEKELPLTGWAPGSGALALQLALRVGILVRRQSSRPMRRTRAPARVECAGTRENPPLLDLMSVATIRRMNAIEAKRIQLFALISEVDPEVIVTRPQSDKWSVREIVEHLVLAEIDVLGAPESLSERPALRRGPKDRVLYLVVMFVLRFDIPVKVPSSGMIPTGAPEIETLEAQWEANHRLLSDWMEASDPGALRRPLFTHPVAGPMTTTDALRMLEVHLDHHIRQIHAIIGQAPSARPA